MKKQFRHFLAVSFTILSLIAVNACKKDHFDEPPGNTTDPNLPVNITIAEIVALHDAGGGEGTFQRITEDKTLTATVIADDKSGNFYKSIVIDDGTAGITLALDRADLYNDYPVGRKIYVKLNGLTIGDNGGLPQIGGGIDSISNPLQPELASISSALITKFVVKGPAGQTVPIQKVSLGSLGTLNPAYLNRLIQVDTVEFDGASKNKTWGGVIGGPSGGYMDRTIQDCFGNTAVISTGAYSTFSQKLTPTGQGTLLAIYSVFAGDPQLVMRDAGDATMDQTIACPVETTLFLQDFNGVSTSGNLSITDWVNYTTSGTKAWYGSGSSNKFARISAFNSSQPLVVGWLITPAINLDGSSNETLYFRTNVFSPLGSTKLEVLYSTDYTGSGSPDAASWTVLSSVPNVNTNWSNAAPVSLGGISGSAVHFAFRYTGGDPGNTTQYNVDDVKITYFQ